MTAPAAGGTQPGTGAGGTGPVAEPAVPASPEGLVFRLQHGGEPDVWVFGPGTTGFQREDSVRPGEDHPGKPFSYTYRVAGEGGGRDRRGFRAGTDRDL